MSSTSSKVIALHTHNGLVGSHLLKHLLQAHRAGEIKLVILHRESSDLSTVPKDAGVETRLVDLSEKGLEVNKKAVEGVEVVISAIGAPGLVSQTHLIDALSTSPSFKTFIHSDFGANWTDDEKKIPALQNGIGKKDQVIDHAKQKRVALTHIRVGLFDSIFFGYNAAGTDVKGNKVLVYKDSLANPFRITSLDYLGYAVTKLVSSSSASALANTTHQIYDLAPTGQDLVDALTKIHGTPSELTQYTQEELERDVKGPSAIGAALKAKWGENTWGSEENRFDGVSAGWKEESLEAVIRGWIDK